MQAYDMNDLSKRIGYWVLCKRREKGLTRADLEKISGVSQFTIRNLELPSVRQSSGPQLDTLIPVLVALGVTDPIGKILEDR